MVSMQGVYPFFDYGFAYPQEVLRKKPVAKTYPANSVMGFLQAHYPSFAFLVRTARLDQQLADPMDRCTVFVPEQLPPEDVLVRMDIDACRRFVKYHMMQGVFPKQVLFTSPFQQLQSTIKGEWLRAVIQGPNQLLVNQSPVLSFDHTLQNGIVHVVAFPLTTT